MAEPEKSPQGPDAYQAKYMGGPALYHDKIRAPLGFHLLFLLPVLVSVGTALVGRAPLFVPLLTSAFILSIWALFSVLRISVSHDEVYVQYGLFGPRIPVRDIEHCEAVDYSFQQYGGWGIRYGFDGSVAYNMMGDHGRAVKIVYKKGKKSQTVLVASPDPERLAAAIQQACTAALGSTGRVRVEVEGAEKVDEAASEAAA